ncbi:Soyasapogenol B glucuronide galactosyltransferase [Stylosanthes scabra]|uniref:Soyasapogenol B glucuronide galactosyltransferase n=1 Tax=Stylosanthes scabra TaxID=79078 RepID=A0ABU6W6E6_9FABA|nr:Soyasapogenol B glucuronide galactosyltransferase [Stylosanthes scabra]
MVDMARAFAMHGGVDVTIITTSGNATIFQSSIDRDSSRGVPIRTHAIKFPALQVDLPVGIETFNADTPLDLSPKIYEGLAILQPEIEKLFEELKADCIVSDMFHPWTVDAAAKLGVPRIVFYAASCLSRCAVHSLEQHGSGHKKVVSDDEKFILEGLPHVLQMSRLQLPDWIKKPNGYTYLMSMINDSAKRSYGAVFNSFFELEGAYEEHYKEAYGTKCWSLGPVSMWVNKDDSDKIQRGLQEKVLVVDEEEEEGWLQWLNSKKEGSVLYVSFGSLNKFPSSQLVEIAHALENSGHDFIWVVRKTNNDDEHNKELGFMEEFEERVRSSNRGYLIWGWAPQLLILENPSIGGMVTHCGWNTVVESMSVGLAMVTWPLFAEHFFNEKLVVDVLRIGVSVGNKEWRNWNEFGIGVVKREEIGRAIEFVMGCGEEGEEMRVRAKAFSVAAKKAIEVGGTSHANVVELIQELRSLKVQRVINYGI